MYNSAAVDLSGNGTMYENAREKFICKSPGFRTTVMWIVNSSSIEKKEVPNLQIGDYSELYIKASAELNNTVIQCSFKIDKFYIFSNFITIIIQGRE